MSKVWPAFNDEQLSEVYRQLIDGEMRTWQDGRKEYARTENVFANFNRIAKAMNVAPERVLMVYALKHLDGIISWINGHDSQRESVHGRILDLRVYLAILDAMIHAYEGGYVSEDPEGLE